MMEQQKTVWDRIADLVKAQQQAAATAANDVLKERLRQMELWGLQRHDLGKWLAILVEEVGEFAEAAGPLMGLGTGKPTDSQDAYEEIIQVAAVAIAIAEQLKEGWGK